MNRSYDALLRGGLVVDPINHMHGIVDVAITDGRIEEIAPTITGSAKREHDLDGLLVMPGIVDPHVHLSPWLGGPCGHRMLALAGVTTALDMAGPIGGVVDLAACYGTGLNIACIDYLRPGHTVESEDPSTAELENALSTAMAKGAIGFKLLGGHFPLTPEAAGRSIEVVANAGAYIAFHAGTLASSSTMEGMNEACELAAGHAIHLAHINSYTRGRIRPAVVEGEEAITLLEQHPNIWSESYLAPFNGVSAKCAQGRPESLATCKSLEYAGFEPTEADMEIAIEAGAAFIHQPVDGVVTLTMGPKGVAAWKERATDIGASFFSNPPEPRLRLATAKHESGQFAVDALGTDGGGIPRNDIVSRGLALVRLNALDITEFVRKSSVNSAQILGLKNKGHLGIGADADVTVLDLEKMAAVLSYANGRRIMEKGEVYGRGTRMITTPAGEEYVLDAGLEPLVIECGTMLRH